MIERNFNPVLEWFSIQCCSQLANETIHRIWSLFDCFYWKSNGLCRCAGISWDVWIICVVRIRWYWLIHKICPAIAHPIDDKINFLRTRALDCALSMLIGHTTFVRLDAVRLFSFEAMSNIYICIVYCLYGASTNNSRNGWKDIKNVAQLMVRLEWSQERHFEGNYFPLYEPI